MATNLPVTPNFDRLVFIPGIGQVSRFGERKLPPGHKKKFIFCILHIKASKEVLYSYRPAEPVDLEHSAQHLCVHASRKDPVDRRSSVMRLRRQTCETCTRQRVNPLKSLRGATGNAAGNVARVPWNLPLSLTEKTRMTLRAERNAAFSFFSFTGSVDQTP